MRSYTMKRELVEAQLALGQKKQQLFHWKAKNKQKFTHAWKIEKNDPYLKQLNALKQLLLTLEKHVE